MIDQTKQMPPILKTHVNDLVIGDYVLIEDEFGNFFLGQVTKFSPNRQLIHIERWQFYIRSGKQFTAHHPENLEVVVGRYRPEKTIHRGNGVLYTEAERFSVFTRRSLHRDRKKLISEIKKATVSDWLLFSDKELVEIVEKLARKEHLELTIL